RPVSLARKRRGARSQAMDRRAEHAQPPLSGRNSATIGDREARRGIAAFGACAALRLSISQAALRDEAATAAQSAVACRVETDRHARKRANNPRSVDARSTRPHDDRFLSPLVRWPF